MLLPGIPIGPDLIQSFSFPSKHILKCFDLCDVFCRVFMGSCLVPSGVPRDGLGVSHWKDAMKFCGIDLVFPISSLFCRNKALCDGPLDRRFTLSGGFGRLSESVSHRVLSRSKWTVSWVSGVFRIFDWVLGGSVVKIS